MFNARLYRRLPHLLASFILVAAIGCSDSDAPTDPAGGARVATVSGSGSLVLDETVLGYAPIPGLSVTLTSPAGTSTDLLIETDGGIQVNSLFAAAVCFTDLAVFVDDAPVGPGRRVGVTNTPDILYNVGSFGFSVTTALPPGTHTITVRAKPFTPLPGVQCYVSSAADGSTLPGRPKLQAVLNVVSF